jgi:hypothetical protein
MLILKSTLRFGCEKCNINKVKNLQGNGRNQHIISNIPLVDGGLNYSKAKTFYSEDR